MSLPIDDIFVQLKTNLNQNKKVILQAPPGAGKSTRLPLLLLETGQYTATQQILILEPRRVAARQIAQYLASQLQEKVGQRIGLKMRGENRVSGETIVTVVTDGVMVRQLQSDPELNHIALIIFDEFHERALQTDLALALSLDAQQLNDQVRILIMSATLDLERLSLQLDAPIVEAQGRQYPVDIKYIPANIIPTLAEIETAVLLAINEQTSSILVFLSGIGEIKRLQQSLEQKLPDSMRCFPLYGGLSIDQQSSAIEPIEDGKRKIVLATNIAQTSLTIDGVDVVVDAGIEKLVQYQPKMAAEQLNTQPISIASAIQRMGRAGRLRPGVCYRLGSKEQFERRRQYDVAEIERVDLSQLLLEVSIWGAEFEDLFWLSKPEQSLISFAKQKLLSLGYWQESAFGYKPTELVSHFQRYGTDLHLSKMLLKAQKNNDRLPSLLASACVLCCYLEQQRGNDEPNLIRIMERFSSSDWHKLNPYIQRLAQKLGLSRVQQRDIDVDYIGLLLAWAYPDRIAKKQGKQWKLSNGVGVVFHQNQIEPKSKLIVVASFNASQYGQFVNLYSEVDLTQIEHLYPELLTVKEVAGWSSSELKPFRCEQVCIGQIVLTEKPLALTLTSEDWQQIWQDLISQQGWKVLHLSEELEILINKLALINSIESPFQWPSWNKKNVLLELTKLDGLLTPYLSEIRNIKALKKFNIAEKLMSSMDWSMQQTLAEYCPDHYQTPAGNRRRINYQTASPSFSCKLQEMFGEPVTPSICKGQIALTIELLSPAQRPLQVTKDLAHFWSNAYTEVKKEMKGRYPKHPWPDDPVSFVATSKTKSQLK